MESKKEIAKKKRDALKEIKPKRIEEGFYIIRVSTKFDKQTLEILDTKRKKLGFTRSEYIRQLVINDDEIIETSNNMSDNKESKLLLNIANNLNQNTKFANSNKMVSEKLENTLNLVLDYLNDKFK